MATKHEYDKALFRLTSILTRLNQGEMLCSKELSQEFGVCERTIRRDINERLSHFPIVKQDGKWQFKNGYSISKVHSSAQAISLEALEIVIQSIGGNFSNILKPLISKLKISSDTPFLSCLPIEDPVFQLTLIEKIHAAVQKSKIVSFQYNNKTRQVEPYKVVNFEGYWYLFGYELDTNKYKTYYLKDIKLFELLNDAFKSRPESKSLIANALNSWFKSDQQPFTVVLRANVNIAKYFIRRPLSATQQITKANNDGSIDIGVQVTSIEEIIHEIKKWQPDLLVVSPSNLKQIAIDSAKKFIEQQTII